MSFFFDVWTNSGFVLASDVRLLVNGEPGCLHKIAFSGRGSTVNCAIAVCGDYPESCLQHFHHAWMTKDTLHDVAQDFASHWVDKYAGTNDYSAVHLVGFENSPHGPIPQVWFWCNWDGENYLSKEVLDGQLNDFSNPIPHNNHIPQKINQSYKRFPHTLEEEHQLVAMFLTQVQPYFTWNGDTTFWRSASEAVTTAMNLVKANNPNLSLDNICELTGTCIEFLIKLGSLLPNSTVGFSSEGDFDLVKVTFEGSTWVRHAQLS